MDLKISRVNRDGIDIRYAAVNVEYVAVTLVSWCDLDIELIPRVWTDDIGDIFAVIQQ